MTTCESIIADHSFVISYIHTKATSLLTEQDYQSLAQCTDLEDVILKLTATPYNKYFTEEVRLSKHELKKQLNKSIMHEINEIYRHGTDEVHILLDFFVNNYKLQNFIFLLASKEHEFDLNRSFTKIDIIGDFNELATLKFSMNMNEVYKFCVEHTFLKEYYRRLIFDDKIESNNWQVIHAKLYKMLVQDFVIHCEPESSLQFMRKVIGRECDRKIIETVLNTMEIKDYAGKRREKLFPTISTFNHGTRIRLSICEGFDELKGVVASAPAFSKLLSAEDDEIVNILCGIEMDVYWETFLMLNDLSCLYGYLKIKEQEIKNILMIIECLNMQKKDFMRNLVMRKE